MIRCSKYFNFCGAPEKVIFHGGGAENKYLMHRIKETIKAEEILRDLLITKNNDPSLWLQLSEVQRAGKNIIGYHLSRGEYLMLLGDFENALNQFKFALGLSNNSFQISETIMTKINLAQDKLGARRGF